MLPVLCVVLAMSANDDLAQAKLHFHAGKAHYELGNYSEAVREFAAGYALAPRPEFLINLGQAYRANGDVQHALEMFQRYLEKAPPRARDRKQVEALIADLKARAPPPAAAAPLTEVEPEPAPSDEPLKKSEAGPLLIPTEPTTTAVPLEEPKKLSPLVWVIPLAAVVVAGVITGVVLSTQSVNCSGAGTLGCIDLRNR